MTKPIISLCLMPLLLVALCGQAQAAEPARCDGVQGYASAGARTFLWRPEWIARARERIRTSPEWRTTLKRAADKALTRGPYSVMDKTQLPHSGDRHDYVSLAPYWWPDASKPDGRPYVRRDGVINPERSGEGFDMSRSQKMGDDVQTLALGYALLGDEAYARQAATLLRVWFLDPQTRMNPNLTYAQAVPGQSSGRGEGLIDALRFQPVVESIGLIAPSGALTAAEQQGLEAWFGQLADWMETSPNGKAAGAKSNNHGLYYDVMRAHFALYARQETRANRILSGFAANRLRPQMSTNGSFPEELTRTRSFHYSVWTLDGALLAAQLGQCVGVDLWSWSADGRSLRSAVDYMAPYIAGTEAWPLKDIDLADPKRRASETAAARRVLYRAAWGFGDVTLSGPAEHGPPTSGFEDDLLIPEFKK